MICCVLVSHPPPTCFFGGCILGIIMSAKIIHCLDRLAMSLLLWIMLWCFPLLQRLLLFILRLIVISLLRWMNNGIMVMAARPHRLQKKSQTNGGLM